MNQHRFVWHELSTTDVAGAQKFYGEIFGWKFDGEGYIHIKTPDGKDIGGLRGGDEPPMPAWLGYIAVEDVARACAMIQEHHGQVFVPPQTIEGTGTFAVAVDPTGAAFAPWLSARPGMNAPDTEMAAVPAAGTFCWDELTATNPDAASKFYAAVFGWEPHAVDMGGGNMYTLFHRPGTKGFGGQPVGAGGMTRAPSGIDQSFWLPYIAVENADKATEQATRLGGKVIVAPTDIPNTGRFACWADPQGAAIAVLQPAPMMK